MAEDKLNLKFFPNIPCFNHIDKGIIYSFKIPHAVQLKNIVLHLDYTDYRQTMKTLDKIKKEPWEICDDFDEMIERLMKYKNDYNYHPQVNNLSLFNRIEIRSDNLNCMIGFPMDKFVNNKEQSSLDPQGGKISLDKILPLPPETITLNTEIRMFRNVDDYKCNDLYITVDKLYYDCDEPNFIKLTELEKYKIYPRGKINNQELIKYKVNDGLVVLRKNTCINIELSAIFKEIHLVYKNKIVADEEIKSFNNLKIYIDYKLTDITTLTELFDYIKQHKTVCFNIEFEDNKYEDYYIYYKTI